jgi:hypothetical protein
MHGCLYIQTQLKLLEILDHRFCKHGIFLSTHILLLLEFCDFLLISITVLDKFGFLRFLYKVTVASLNLFRLVSVFFCLDQGENDQRDPREHQHSGQHAHNKTFWRGDVCSRSRRRQKFAEFVVDCQEADYCLKSWWLFILGESLSAHARAHHCINTASSCISFPAIAVRGCESVIA